MHRRVEPLWGVTDVAAYLGVPVTTLYPWRHHRYGPPGRRVGRYVPSSPTTTITPTAPTLISTTRSDDSDVDGDDQLRPRVAACALLPGVLRIARAADLG